MEESVGAEALNQNVLGVSGRSRWPVQQDDRGRGRVLVGDLRGDLASHISEALRGVPFSL